MPAAGFPVDFVHRFRPDFLERSRTFWQRRTARPLAHEDAREMVTNISGFFDLLEAWSRSRAGGGNACAEVRRDR